MSSRAEAGSRAAREDSRWLLAGLLLRSIARGATGMVIKGRQVL